MDLALTFPLSNLKKVLDCLEFKAVFLVKGVTPSGLRLPRVARGVQVFSSKPRKESYMRKVRVCFQGNVERERERDKTWRSFACKTQL